MNYTQAKQTIALHQKEIRAIREEIRQVQTDHEPEVIDDYTFSTHSGSVALSQLFGEHQTMFMVHNMGKSCTSCTLWADGFNGILPHLQNRGAFVLSSPDSPAVQAEFARSRGWNMTMVSHQGTSFAQDMGYRAENGNWWPGVSIFRTDGSRICRLSDTSFGPGDDFCGLWHLFDLLPEGVNGWEPMYSYEAGVNTTA